MINDFRTHLADLPAALGAYGPLEEYVPPDFTPGAATDAVARARRIIFGESPDRAGVLARTRQLVALVAASRWAAWVTMNDARVTYETAPGNGLEDSLGATVVPSPNSPPATAASPATPSPSGVRRETWTLHVTD